MPSLLPGEIHHQSHAADLLVRMAGNPPCSLVLEGGSPEQRSALAVYMLQTMHCSNPAPSPCLECDLCLKIKSGAFRDLFWLTPLTGLGVEEVREMRPALSQNPHHRWRMVVVEEAGEMNAACANALLKSVEEPVSRNIFVFLANERGAILPTIVSRSFVLTLGRCPGAALEADQEKIFGHFSEFVRYGTGFIHTSSRKDDIDLPGARQLLARVRLDLARGMRGEDSLFKGLGPEHFHSMLLALQKAEEALSYKVRVDLVVQWLALTMWQIFNNKN